MSIFWNTCSRYAHIYIKVSSSHYMDVKMSQLYANHIKQILTERNFQTGISWSIYFLTLCRQWLFVLNKKKSSKNTIALVLIPKSPEISHESKWFSVLHSLTKGVILIGTGNWNLNYLKGSGWIFKNDLIFCKRQKFKR